MPESVAHARTYPIYEGVAKALESILPQARQRARVIIEERRQTGESTATSQQSGGH
jgi:hypothetical protein